MIIVASDLFTKGESISHVQLRDGFGGVNWTMYIVCRKKLKLFKIHREAATTYKNHLDLT